MKNTSTPSSNVRYSPTPSKDEIEFAVLIQSLEIHFAYYAQSEGVLYEDVVLQSCDFIEESLKVIENKHPDLFIELKKHEKDFPDPRNTLQVIRDWKTRGSLREQFFIAYYFGMIKSDIFRRMNFSNWPHMTFTTETENYLPSVLKWNGYLNPFYLLGGNVDEKVKEATKTETIAVIGDIRRSQDLMTYAVSTEDFFKRMKELSDFARKALIDNYGCFDKFTGDGFVGYFNKELCQSRGRDYLKCFTKFCKDIHSFSKMHFREWQNNVRKLPNVDVGLGIGADIGLVSIQNESNHLIAVGDAIVWASRMASEAKAGEVVVNNLLRVKLETEYETEKFEGKSKNGEQFSAFRVDFKKPITNKNASNPETEGGNS